MEAEESPKSNSYRTLKVIIFITTFFLLFISGFLASYKFITDSNSNAATTVFINPQDRIEVYIEPGSDTAKVADTLYKNGIITAPLLFRIYSNLNGFDGFYKYGTHEVAKHLGYSELMTILIGNPKAVKVMIPEGYNFLQIKDLLVSKKLVDGDKFTKAANTVDFKFEFLKNVPFNGPNVRLEGYLFPDTYEFDPNMGEEAILEIMLTNFDDRFLASYYDDAKAMGLTTAQVITLASIVEKEAADPLDRPRIAGVFLNRLSGNFGTMKLESCATLEYIIFNRTGAIKPVLNNDDTLLDSPYNTYKNEGLPPGPISNPGMDSIDAVLNAESSSYLYFVSKNDGTGSSYFSTNLADHLAAAALYGGVDQITAR
jgi:UPF0755 protein